MTILRRLSLIILALCAPLLLISHVLLSVFNSGISTNNLLKDSGVYAIVSAQMRSSIITSQRVPEKDQEIFQKSVDSAVTDDAVETLIQPALVDIVSWLQQPQETPSPDIILIIKPIKDALLAALQTNGLPATELNLFKTTLTQQVPDQIKLSSLQQLTGAQGAQADTQSLSSQQEFEKTILIVKNAYGAMAQAQVVLAIIMSVCLIIYILSARYTRVSTIMAPSLTLAIESLVIAIIAYGTPFVLRSNGLNTMESLPTNVASRLANHFITPSLIVCAFSAATYTIALLLWKRGQKQRGNVPSVKTSLPRR